MAVIGKVLWHASVTRAELIVRALLVVDLRSFFPAIALAESVHLVGAEHWKPP